MGHEDNSKFNVRYTRNMCVNSLFSVEFVIRVHIPLATFFFGLFIFRISGSDTSLSSVLG